jgi:hypothetical protein
MFYQTQYTQYLPKVIGYTQSPFIHPLYRSFRSYHSTNRQNEGTCKITPSSASIQNHIKKTKQTRVDHTHYNLNTTTIMQM